MGPQEILVVVLTGLQALAWIPITVYFWRSWRARGAPLSLAIAVLSGFQTAVGFSTYAFLVGDPLSTVLALAGGNLLVVLNFAICFRWQRRNFPDARNRPARGSDPPPDMWRRPRRPPTDTKKTA